MDTLDSLKKSIDTSKSVKKVVTTMKALSGANIKKYENAVKILFAYRSNIELGLQAILMGRKDIQISDLDFIKVKKSDHLTDLYIVFGSNQGLCGRFNDRVLNFMEEDLKKNLGSRVVVVGERLNMLMDGKKFNAIKALSIPSTIEAISNTIYEILAIIEEEKLKGDLGKVFLYYTRNDESISGSVTKERLIPINKKLLEKLRTKTWLTNNIPYWRVETNILISDLLTQYIFTLLYNALANSIVSELKNRLMTLQNAENNISDLIKMKSLEYNQKRQGTITSELIDVVSGYQVSKKKK